MPIKLLHLPPKTFTVTSTGHFHLTEKLTVSGDHTPSPSFPLIFLFIQIPCSQISCVDFFIQPKPYSLELNLGMTLMFAIRMMSYTFRWKVEDQCLLGVACCRFFVKLFTTLPVSSAQYKVISPARLCMMSTEMLEQGLK